MIAGLLPGSYVDYDLICDVFSVSFVVYACTIRYTDRARIPCLENPVSPDRLA